MTVNWNILPMKTIAKLWARLIDLISPRACNVCGRRLTMTEDTMCTLCNMNLPRTNYAKDTYNNEMAKMFWILLPIEKAVALFYYSPHAQTANLIYNLKYHNKPYIGVTLGRMLAEEYLNSGFFDDIDVIVPVPIAKKRRRQRGYNQSEMIAQGLSDITSIPVDCNIITRDVFVESQTKKGRQGRMENVSAVFKVNDKANITGKHILLVDDILTTGATLVACGKELMKAGNIKISIATLGITKT